MKGPNDQSSAPLEKARDAVRRSRHKKQKKTKAAAIFIGLPLIAVLWYINSRNHTDLPEKKVCAETDGVCIGDKWLSQSRGKCTAALENQLAFIPTWTDSLTQPRFAATGWYEPMKSVIYTGNAIEVMNGFGAKTRAQYFCVVSVNSGAVIKSGFPSL